MLRSSSTSAIEAVIAGLVVAWGDNGSPKVGLAQPSCKSARLTGWQALLMRRLCTLRPSAMTIHRIWEGTTVNERIPEAGLEAQGIETRADIHWNLVTARLVEAAVARSEGKLSADGPLVVETDWTGAQTKDCAGTLSAPDLAETLTVNGPTPASVPSPSLPSQS